MNKEKIYSNKEKNSFKKENTLKGRKIDTLPSIFSCVIWVSSCSSSRRKLVILFRATLAFFMQSKINS